MIILQTGQAKSGNFWLYKIIQNAMLHGGIQQRSFIKNHRIYPIAKSWELSYKEQADIDVMDINPGSYFFRISSIFKMPIIDVDDYIRQCSHVWTHSAFCQRSITVFPKFDKVIHIIRDPRDIALSKSRFVFTPYMKNHYPRKETDAGEFLEKNFNNIMRKWVRHMAGYLENKDEMNIHMVFYERFLERFDEEMERLLNYLEIELKKSSVDQIKNDVSFKTMKKSNPMHVSKGRSRGWTTDLNGSMKKNAVKITGPMFKLLGYPVSEHRAEGDLPDSHGELSIKKIKNAVKHSQKLTVKEKVRLAYQFMK